MKFDSPGALWLLMFTPIRFTLLIAGVLPTTAGVAPPTGVDVGELLGVAVGVAV